MKIGCLFDFDRLPFWIVEPFALLIEVFPLIVGFILEVADEFRMELLSFEFGFWFWFGCKFEFEVEVGLLSIRVFNEEEELLLEDILELI